MQKVDLKTLSPSTLVIRQVPDDPNRFYVDAYTTNSSNIIDSRYFKDGRVEPFGLSNKSSFGPYEKGSDMENRVKNVLSRLIVYCGGKKDSF